MRRRIVRATLGVTVLAVLLFGVPMAVAAAQFVHTTLVNELVRAALTAFAQLDQTLGQGDALEPPAPPTRGQVAGSADAATTLDLADEGSFTTAPPITLRATGLGLALASRLAAEAGGRLVLTSRSPTSLTMLIPRSGPAQVP